MCRGCEQPPYESFLSPDDHDLIWNTYISATMPTWSDRTPFLQQSIPREVRDNIWEWALDEECCDITRDVHTKVPCKDRDSVIDGDDTQPQSSDPMDIDSGQPPRGQPLQGLRVSTRRNPLPNVLQGLNQSMRQEYEERADNCRTLEFRDSDLYNFNLLALPGKVAGVLWAHFYLILFCHSCVFMNHQSEHNCRATMEIAQHKSWVEDVLAQLPHLRSVSIFVHLAHSDFVLGKKVKVPCEVLVERKLEELRSLPGVKEVVVYRYKFDEYPNFDGPKELVSRWRPERKDSVDRESLQ